MRFRSAILGADPRARGRTKKTTGGHGLRLPPRPAHESKDTRKGNISEDACGEFCAKEPGADYIPAVARSSRYWPAGQQPAEGRSPPTAKTQAAATPATRLWSRDFFENHGRYRSKKHKHRRGLPLQKVGEWPESARRRPHFFATGHSMYGAGAARIRTQPTNAVNCSPHCYETASDGSRSQCCSIRATNHDR